MAGKLIHRCLVQRSYNLEVGAFYSRENEFMMLPLSAFKFDEVVFVITL